MHGAPDFRTISMNNVQETQTPPLLGQTLTHFVKKIKTKRFVLLVIIPILVLSAIMIMYLMSGRYVETDNAYVKADKIPISSQVSGIIQETLVQENQHVVKNQLLYRLDPTPFKVAVAKAESKLAQVRIDILGLKASYYEKQAEIVLARTKFDFSLRNKKRQTDLAAKQFASLSSLDEAKESAEIAAQQIVTVERDLQRLAESLAGGIDEPVEKHPSYLVAKSELDQAQLDLAHTEIRAPNTGTINAPPKPGQYIATGAITMTLVTNNHPWVEANFPEKELTHVHAGQEVVLSIDLYPGISWKGIVESISPATGSEFSIIPAQNATGNWVKVAQRVAVRIKLLPTTDNQKLRSGLSAWVKIDTKKKNNAPA